jgi:predicted transcriptional regulator of viral defense system
MEVCSIEQFKEKNTVEVIKKLIKINGGYITSKQITEIGIHRMYLNIMLKKGIIEKVDKGIYIDKKTIEDTYYTFQLRYPKTIFSRFTALYFYGLTETYPHTFDITTDYNYHVEKINQKHSIIKCNKEILYLGLTEQLTPLGHKVRTYDRERCICDIIKSKNKLDIEQVKKSVKMYVNDNNKNLNKLTEYSKKMGINKEVMEFVGMFYE